MFYRRSVNKKRMLAFLGLIASGFVVMMNGAAQKSKLNSQIDTEEISSMNYIFSPAAERSRDEKGEAEEGSERKKSSTAFFLWISISVSFVALGVSAYTLHDRSKWRRYHYLASIWYDILKIEIEFPELVDPSKTKNYKLNYQGNALLKYNSYARMCWGFLEDIFKSKYHGANYYKPTIERYKNLHYSWLKDNKQLFKKEFIKYIAVL